MNRHLHNCDDVFISARQGWEEMKFLLDKNLPVNDKKNGRKFYKSVTIAAALTAAFLFSSLVLQNNYHRKILNKVLLNYAANQRAVISINQHDYAKFYSHNSHKRAKIDMQHPSALPLNLSKKVEILSNGTQPNYQFLSLIKFTLGQTNEHDLKQICENLAVQNKGTKIPEHVLAKDYLNSDSVNRVTKEKISDNKNIWNLSVGFGVNGMIGKQQNLQPFPVAEARYNFSAYLFMAIGLSVGSPVLTDSYGISKSVYLNDTTNNVQLYNKVINYKRLYYTDIPLLAGININKELSIQGGLQASFLLNTKNSTSIEKYDFQMRLTNSPTNNFGYGAAAAIEKDYTINMMKIDYRFTAGIQYSLNRASLKLMYQYSPKPLLTGDYVITKKCQLVTMNILYRLK